MISRKHVVTACFGAFISIMAAYWIQLKILYMPRTYDEDETLMAERFLQRRGLNLETLEFSLSTFTQRAYLVSYPPARQRQVKLVVLFGGNCMTALDWCDWVTEIRDFLPSREGASFLLIDYPGYGDNKGSPSPDSIQDATNLAVEASLASFREKSMVVTDFIVMGHSIGAAVASRWVASQGTSVTFPAVNTLVLSAPFTSVVEMAHVIFPFIPVSVARLLSRHNWDNVKALSRITDKNLADQIFIVHGDQDEIVPFAMGKRLSEVGDGRIKLIPVPDAFHNNLLNYIKIYGLLLGSLPSGKL